ncbi:uncharacterized protein Dwil_GK24903 [Drosophila willistoni]|uniref:Calponin-homology (CH) domain-containing protein n=1 Tax=Drosophila willistoni TaxID=7260 RepID=B4NDJ8_DROWI|nr:microtubule-associated protein RP/EB family member 1 [Drosophila willistoni]EDW82904.1 uncharacterized protein Dwil_GK24903 [Drosophila willistoni]
MSMKNVSATTGERYLSRTELLDWVNGMLGSNYTKLNDLRTGAAYCQLFHILKPDAINVKKVKWTTTTDFDYIQNFRLLQMGFHRSCVQKDIPVNLLIKDTLQDHLQFVRWFYKFFMINRSAEPDSYDASAERKHALGDRKLTRNSKQTSTQLSIKMTKPRTLNRSASMELNERRGGTAQPKRPMATGLAKRQQIVNEDKQRLQKQVKDELKLPEVWKKSYNSDSIHLSLHSTSTSDQDMSKLIKSIDDAVINQLMKDPKESQDEDVINQLMKDPKESQDEDVINQLMKNLKVSQDEDVINQLKDPKESQDESPVVLKKATSSGKEKKKSKPLAEKKVSKPLAEMAVSDMEAIFPKGNRAPPEDESSSYKYKPLPTDTEDDSEEDEKVDKNQKDKDNENKDKKIKVPESDDDDDKAELMEVMEELTNLESMHRIVDGELKAFSAKIHRVYYKCENVSTLDRVEILSMLHAPESVDLNNLS